MDTINPMPDGANPPPRPTVEEAGSSPLPSPPRDIIYEASKTVTESDKQSSDEHVGESPQEHTAEDEVGHDSRPNGVAGHGSGNDADSGNNRDSDDSSTSDESDWDIEGDMLLFNTFVSQLCFYLLGKPREEWTDYLDCVLDTHDDSMFSVCGFLEPHTLRLMRDVCNGVADLRRGGTGYFKPELYRPPGPGPLQAYPVPNIMDRVADPHERGPDPYDEGPDAHYEGHAPSGFTAIGRYHYNKQIWNYCDDLLNLTPDRWMDSLPGVVELIFDPRERTNSARVEFQPETIALLQAIQDAFDGVPPSCIPGHMSPGEDYFEFLPSPANFDIRHEIDWVPRMTRHEMLASVPDRALHIRMYGRPKPDRRLEKKHRGCIVTSRGARDDSGGYIVTEQIKESYDGHFTLEQRERFQDAFDRVMMIRAEALRDHDTIDRARAQYRNALASVNKPFSEYLSPFMDRDALCGSDKAAKTAEETLAALDDARNEVCRGWVKMREATGCKCWKSQPGLGGDGQFSLWKALCLGFLLGLLTCAFAM